MKRVKKELLPKVLRKLLSCKLKSNMRKLKNGLLTLKYDKQLYRSNKIIGLMGLFKRKVEGRKLAAFRKLQQYGTRIPKLQLNSLRLRE